MDIRNLKENEFMMLDGGMGTMLQAGILELGKCLKHLILKSRKP